MDVNQNVGEIFDPILDNLVKVQQLLLEEELNLINAMFDRDDDSDILVPRRNGMILTSAMSI